MPTVTQLKLNYGFGATEKIKLEVNFSFRKVGMKGCFDLWVNNGRSIAPTHSLLSELHNTKEFSGFPRETLRISQDFQGALWYIRYVYLRPLFNAKNIRDVSKMTLLNLKNVIL